MISEPTDLAAELKSQARAQGADLVGVASAAKPDEAAHLDPWLASGMHGAMSYMATRAAVRQDLRSWYPDAKSVLLCGFNYAGNMSEATVPGKGRVSRYARLPDYHDSLKVRLTAVLDWLKQRRPGADGRVFVDSSPILERAYARLAGLGWIGKNTMLINRSNGSYFFIAGIALNLELPSDGSDPVDDACGTCTACLDACPTDAFPRERVLDASKCVSYLNIENRGAVPEELREGVGDRLFGCDICQEVCPWNRFAEPGSAFPPAGEAALDLEELCALDDAAFRARFRGSPLWRSKRRGLLRNALLVMGNSGDARHAPTLERFSRDEDPVLAEQAAWSLRRLRRAQSV